MMLDSQITFHGVDRSAAIEDAIIKRIQRLEKFYDRIMGCRVAVEAPHRHQRSGKHYRVRIDLTVPGGEIVVGREPDETAAHADVYVAIRDAFNALGRRLQDHARLTRGVPKPRVGSLHGRVVKLFGAEGYGFLTTREGREVYFNQQAVLNGGFQRLAIGDEVRFDEERGEQGPQASTVVRVGQDGHHEVPKVE